MKTVLALTAATALASISVPAFAATSFTIDAANTSITELSNPTLCVFGSCDLTASLATYSPFSLEVGEERTFDFANIMVSSGFGVGSAALEAMIAFLPPVGGSAETGGSANYVRAGGIFRPGVLAGSLIWDNPSQSVTGDNGSMYTVTFGNLVGAQFGSNVTVPVTVRLDSIAAAVPEPATWAMLLIGFGAVGASMRYRRKQTVRVAFA